MGWEAGDAGVACGVELGAWHERTGEEFKDEEAPADVVEHLIPQEASRLVAALCHVQDRVTPHHLQSPHLLCSISHGSTLKQLVQSLAQQSSNCRDCSLPLK